MRDNIDKEMHVDNLQFVGIQLALRITDKNLFIFNDNDLSQPAFTCYTLLQDRLRARFYYPNGAKQLINLATIATQVDTHPAFKRAANYLTELLTGFNQRTANQPIANWQEFFQLYDLVLLQVDWPLKIEETDFTQIIRASSTVTDNTFVTAPNQPQIEAQNFATASTAQLVP